MSNAEVQGTIKKDEDNGPAASGTHGCTIENADDQFSASIHWPAAHLRFEFLDGTFHRGAEVVFGQINLRGVKAQHPGHFSGTLVLENTAIEDLVLFWIRALPNFGQGRPEDILAPFLFPDALDLSVGRQHRG